MAKEILLQEQDLAFSYNSFMGAYTHSTLAPFTLTEGETYKVLWDGTECERVAFSFIFTDGSACVGLGNPLVSGGEDNGDTFVIVHDTTNGYMHFASLEAKDTHTVGVYQEVQDVEDEPDPIVLKNPKGENVEYGDYKKIRLTKASGKKVIYSEGEAVEGVKITPNFANGNHIENAPDGTLVKSAIIQKPDTLLPENIVSGVNVAGVVGSYSIGTEEKTVAADFSSGDMEITPSEGKLLEKVAVTKPETLLPENIAAGVDVAGIVGTHEGGGGEDLFASMAMGTLPSDITLNVPYIGQSAFYYNKLIRNIYAPNASMISYTAFYYAALASISIPNVTTIGPQAFLSCHSLTEIDLPNVTFVDYNAFAWCSKLTKITAPMLVSTSTSAFYQTELVSVSFPNMTTLGSGAFYYCTELQNAYLPKVETVRDTAFGNCSSMTSICLPAANSVGNYAFRNCLSLTTVVLPVVSAVGGSMFYSCSKIKSIYMLGSNVASVIPSYGTYYDPISAHTSATYSIFVRASLVDAYKIASGWSRVSSKFVGLTDEEIAALMATLEGTT